MSIDDKNMLIDGAILSFVGLIISTMVYISSDRTDVFFGGLIIVSGTAMIFFVIIG